MFTINDLRLILSNNTDIRVWNNNDPKELLNPTPLFEGKLDELSFTDIIAKETIVRTLCISNVLVFFVNHLELNGRKEVN